MKKEIWKILNDGFSISGIKRKYNLRYKDIKGLFNITEAISNLKNDEYLVIPENQMVFPVNIKEKFYEMDSREFKKHGEQFNMRTKTKEERIKERITPHQLLIDTVKREYDNLSLWNNYSEYVSNHGVEYNLDVFKKIARRGFKFDDIIGNHTLMSQRDLLRGWRLASLIIALDMDVWYSNPGDNFIIKIPSTKEDPNIKKRRYTIIMNNFALNLPEDYGNWVDIEGKKSSDELMKGIDIFTQLSERYKRDELRLDFGYVAAMILRQHYNDIRIAQGSSKNFKRVKKQEINPVLLNIPIAPTKNMINFDFNLDRVYISDKGKLNAGEREILFSVKLYMGGVDKCYYRDDELHSLDNVVDIYKNKFREVVDKIRK